MLNPPLPEEDLAGVMVGHFPPEVQNGMVCGNLKATQGALAYLSNMQALEVKREQTRRSGREYDERDIITRGRINDTANFESRNNHQTRNVRFVQGPRNNSGMGRRSPRQFGRNRDFSGWGSNRRQERHSFNPSAQEFEPRTDDREYVTNPSGREKIQDVGTI
jgi:hypothetical protein